MTEQLADLTRPYEPQAVERRTYAFWERLGYFTPTIDPTRRPFVIAIPPPNITGALHTGHALTFTIEDILIRWHRMLGDPALWLPGTDHAAIATEYLVKQALAQEGLTKEALGRRTFLGHAWEWKAQYHGIIVEQMKRLGVSVDWSRERFTMDEGLSRAVRTVFVRLYDEGLIYRGEYMGNWCPGCKTVVSDLEVQHRDEEGELWYLRYPLAADPSRGIEVATTRPETMLGDTAVAVHPDDARYKDWIGQELELPLVGRRIPVVADAAVDPAFGTGAVKVTPAHDPTDYAIGKRHELPTIEVIGADGVMTAAAGRFQGLDRMAARAEVVEALRQAGALIRTEPYNHAVGHCQRSDDVIEPRISLQWWLKVEPLAGPALEAVRDGRITIIPDRFTKVYTNWLENLHDWAISRQLWWGHQIPVWTCADCGRVLVQIDNATACPGCGGKRLEQDPDTLDTWFSSALWPFSTLGWPEQTADLAYFYPTTVMETGYDILFFWVARMVMMGLHFMGEAPFRTVYLHGMVRDAFGRKMSKTKGNVVDPLDLMDQFGTDALRLSMVTGNSPGNDLRFSEQRIEAGRNFANKLWNAGRFALSYRPPEHSPEAAPLELPERWILSRARAAQREVTRLLEQFQLGEAARAAHDFFWGEYCDWYMEMVKARVLDAAPAGSAARQRGTAAQRTLLDVLEQSLRLLHPFMPYVTEELWQHLRQCRPSLPESVALAPWPSGASAPPHGSASGVAGDDDGAAEEAMAALIATITVLRNYRAEHGIEPTQKLTVAAGAIPGLPNNGYLLEVLANASLVATPGPGPLVKLLVGTAELTIATSSDLPAERARLEAALAEAANEASRARAQLGQPGFVDRAPAAVVAKARERLSLAESHQRRLEAQLAELLG